MFHDDQQGGEYAQNLQQRRQVTILGNNFILEVPDKLQYTYK
jgi:hypothetical protein